MIKNNWDAIIKRFVQSVIYVNRFFQSHWKVAFNHFECLFD